MYSVKNKTNLLPSVWPHQWELFLSRAMLEDSGGVVVVVVVGRREECVALPPTIENRMPRTTLGLYPSNM